MNGLLSLAMIVKDEAFFLPACLESVRSVVDEMVVVDTGSTDNTVAIAESFGARVLHVPWTDDFSAARNAALAAVRTPWTLILDADEELVADDIPLLTRAIQEPFADAYNIRIVSVMDRAEDISESWVTRIVRAHPALRFRGEIHEQLYQSVVDAKMRLGQLNVRFTHKGYLQSVVQNRQKTDRNRRLLERKLAAHPQDGYMQWQLAQTYFGEGRYDQSADAAKRALKAMDVTAPLWVLVQTTLAKAMLEAGHPKKAVRILQEGQLAHPRYTDFHYLEGIIHLRTSQWDKAIAAFQRCLEIGEAEGFLMTDTGVGGFKALYRLAQALTRRGDTKPAVAHLLLAIRQQPHYRSAWRELMNLLAGSSIAAVLSTLELSLPVDQIVATLRAWPQLDLNETHLLEQAEQAMNRSG